MKLPHVLVVDDDLEFSAAVGGVLQRLGYRATTVADAEGALDALRSRDFDALLVDLRMPGINGHALLRRLKHGDVPPIIAMSGYGTVDDLISLMREGAVDFLRKPFHPDELGSALERAMELSPARPLPAATPAPEASIRPAEAAHRSPQAALRPAEVPSRRAPAPRFADAPHRAAQTPRDVRPPTAPAASELPSAHDLVAELLAALHANEVELPTIAPIGRELRMLASRPACRVEEVLRVIERDPAVATEVLRRSNTSYYRPSTLITDLRGACLRLGNRRVLAIAQEVVVRGLFGASGPLAPIVGDMWRNLVVTAHGARAIAAHLELDDPDEIHAAALLHDLGELVLFKLAAERLLAAGADESALRRLGPEVEAQHEEFGRRLLKAWRMPPALVELAGFHHRASPRPQLRDARVRRAIVVVAWSLACRRGYTWHAGQDGAVPDEQVRLLGADPTELDALFADAPRWLGEDGAPAAGRP